MFRKKQKELVRLINKFDGRFEQTTVSELLSFVEHGEPGIAIEQLSTQIYESDVKISDELEREILSASINFGIPINTHAWVGRTPPYPDLRTSDQHCDTESSDGVSLDSVSQLARSGRLLEAVKMYRSITGVSLSEATIAVKSKAAPE